MTVITFTRRIGVWALGSSCFLATGLPATAFAAQSAACMQASLAHAAHNAKDAAKFDLQCRLSSIKSGGGGAGAAAAQAQARQAHLDQLRANLLARQQQERQQQQQQERQQQQQQLRQQQQQQQLQPRSYPVQARPPQAGAYPAAPARPGVYRALERLRAAQAAAAAAPAYGVAPAAAPPAAPAAPAPVNEALPTSDSAPPPPDPLDAVLTPGPRDTSLSNDQAVAARAKTDLGVFGVALGDPLTRPRCVRGAPSLEPCLAQAGFSMLVAALFRGRIAKLSDFTNVPLHLPEAQCPDWLKAGSCDVVLAMSGGYVYAAFMVVGGEDTQAVIETQLAQKYGKKADKGPLSQCKKDGSAPHPNAPLRSWSMRGLRVEYDPYGATCAYSTWRRGTGQLVVETDTFRRMVTEAGVTAEPKM